MPREVEAGVAVRPLNAVLDARSHKHIDRRRGDGVAPIGRVFGSWARRRRPPRDLPEAHLVGSQGFADAALARWEAWRSKAVVAMRIGWRTSNGGSRGGVI